MTKLKKSSTQYKRRTNTFRKKKSPIFNIFSFFLILFAIGLTVFSITKQIQTQANATVQNLITNGSFENTGTSWLSPWMFGVKTGATATIAQDASTQSDGLYSARVDVTQSNATIWDVQLTQNASISANIPHTINFSAKASTPLTVNVVVQQNYGSYTEYASQNFALTTSWQTYSMSFTPTVTDPQVILVFNMANTAGSIWLDNVSFTNGTVATPTPTQDMTAPAGYSQLQFDDKFQGTTLDSTKWIPQMSDASGIWCNSAVPCPDSIVGYPSGGYNAEYGNPDQVVINNGATLNAQRDTKYSGYTWKAGYITTYNKFTFNQGYVQIKAKMPDSSTGAWAGIWFLQAASANEIDLQESGTICSNNNVNYCMASNLHTTGNSQALIDTGVDLSSGYHIYGMEYKPGQSVTMFLDGKQVAQYTTNVPTGAYNIILTETMAQNATGWHTNVSSSTPSPMSPYNIAEVQVWQQGSGSATPTPTIIQPTVTPTPLPTATPTPADTISPTVSITSPANGSYVTHGTSVSITANANDNVKVSQVQFFVNNVLKCTDTTAPYSCNWRVPTKRGVKYTITAKASDPSNNVGTSSVTVTSK